MRHVLILCLACCVSLTTGDIFELDGSGDVRPTMSPRSPFSRRFRAIYSSSPISLKRRPRTNTRVKRIVRAVLPSLVKTYLDFHLPEEIQFHVEEIIEADQVVPPSCRKNEHRVDDLTNDIKEMTQDIKRMRSRMNHMGSRMDELERMVAECQNAHTTTEIPEATSKMADKNRGKIVTLGKNSRLDARKGMGDDKEDGTVLIETQNKTFLETVRDGEEVDLQKTVILQKDEDQLLQKTEPIADSEQTPNVSCVKPYLPEPESDVLPESAARVLAVSLENPQFFLLEPDDNATEFPLVSEKVRSLVYEPVIRHIIWSNYSSRNPGIYSARLDRPRRVKRLSQMSSEGMAVDPCKRWLFFTSITPRPTLSRMTTKGRHYRKIKDMNKYSPYMYSVAVDPDHGIIYSCHYSALVQTSYDGKSQKELVSGGTSIHAVTIDLVKRKLYYGSWGEIRVISLEDESNKAVGKVGASPRNLIYNNNILYSDKTGDVNAYDVVQEMPVQLGTLNGTAVSLCLIP